MTTTSQLHKEFSGRGQLLQDNRPPIPVRYYLLLSVRPILRWVPAGLQQPIEWEWDKVQGFLTLCDEDDAPQLDEHSGCTLVLDDGTCCIPTLTRDNRRPELKYRVQCPACQLVAPAVVPALRCVS